MYKYIHCIPELDDNNIFFSPTSVDTQYLLECAGPLYTGEIEREKYSCPNLEMDPTSLRKLKVFLSSCALALHSLSICICLFIFVCLFVFPFNAIVKAEVFLSYDRDRCH